MKLLKSLLSILFFFSFVTKVYAVTPITEGSGGFAELPDLVKLFANILSVVGSLAGFALLIVIIRGGISYIVAQGDPKALMSARAALTWGIIGFIAILAAYTIISIVVGFVSVPGIGQFCIPTAGSNALTFCQPK